MKVGNIRSSTAEFAQLSGTPRLHHCSIGYDRGCSWQSMMRSCGMEAIVFCVRSSRTKMHQSITIMNTCINRHLKPCGNDAHRVQSENTAPCRTHHQNLRHSIDLCGILTITVELVGLMRVSCLGSTFIADESNDDPIWADFAGENCPCGSHPR